MTSTSHQSTSDQCAVIATHLPTLARYQDSVVHTDCDTEIKHIKQELEQARLKSLQIFIENACPDFRLSGFVQRALDWKERDLRDFLTKPPVQRTGEDTDKVDYDFLHFKSETVDETHLRSVAHHNIARALRKLSVAEAEIVTHGYTITYATADAQVILLMDYLRQPDVSMTIDHHPRDYRIQHPRQYDNPYFIRKVTDEAVVKAWESLTSNFMVFGLRKQGEVYEPGSGEYQPEDDSPKRQTDRIFTALAWFTDVVRAGKLDFDAKIRCVELPLEQDQGNLCELGLCRDLEWPASATHILQPSVP